MIFCTIDSFDWSKTFENVDADRQVKQFNEAILNIMCNFILNKEINVDDKEPKSRDKNNSYK